MRIEPPPSLPNAAAPIPAASAAAPPPVEPPEERAGIPRVARRAAAQRAVGDALPAELRQRRLAQDHRARLAHPRDHGRIGRGRRRIAGLRAVPRRQPGDIDVVLDRDRHAVERPVRRPAAPAHLRRLGRARRPRRIDRLERGKPRLQPLQPLEMQRNHRRRRERPAAIRLSQRRHRQPTGIVRRLCNSHRLHPYVMSGPRAAARAARGRGRARPAAPG